MFKAACIGDAVACQMIKNQVPMKGKAIIKEGPPNAGIRRPLIMGRKVAIQGDVLIFFFMGKVRMSRAWPLDQFIAGVEVQGKKMARAEMVPQAAIQSQLVLTGPWEGLETLVDIAY